MAVVLAVVLAGPAFCQTYETPDAIACASAAQRVRSQSLTDKAWGAHLAAACRIPSLAGEIAAQLDQMHPDMSGRTIWNEQQWAASALLDSLIQLREPLDASMLGSLAPRFPTEATILMLRNPTGNATLLAAVREAAVPQSVWEAAGSALVNVHPPGLAAALLREVRLTNSVWVSDDGRFPGSAGSLMSGASNLQAPPGFPAVALYRLTAIPAPGDELVCDGAIPIYSRREDISPAVSRAVNWPIDGDCHRCTRNCQECQWQRVRYLAVLAHAPAGEVDHAVDPEVAVRWSNAGQVAAEISRGLEEQKAAVRNLVRMLTSAGVLGFSEIGMTSHIDVKVGDLRGDRSIALPQVAPLEFRIEL